MRYIAAYVLAVMGGNPDPTAEDIRTIVSSVGIDIDESRLNKVITELRGKDLEELIAQGTERLATAFVGGGGKTAPGPVEEGEKPTEDKPAADAGDDDGETDDEDFGMGLFDM